MDAESFHDAVNKLWVVNPTGRCLRCQNIDFEICKRGRYEYDKVRE